jgi:hypothetical protein
MVDDARAHLEEWIVSVGERTHRELIEVLERSRDERSDGNLDSSRIADDCDRYERRLAGLRQRIERLGVALAEQNAGGPNVPRAEEV